MGKVWNFQELKALETYVIKVLPNWYNYNNNYYCGNALFVDYTTPLLCPLSLYTEQQDATKEAHSNHTHARVSSQQ